MGLKRARQLQAAATDSVGIKHGLVAARLRLRQRLADVAFCQAQLAETEAAMAEALQQTGLAPYLLPKQPHYSGKGSHCSNILTSENKKKQKKERQPGQVRPPINLTANSGMRRNEEVVTMIALTAATPAELLRKHLTMSQEIALRALMAQMQADEETVVTSTIADATGMTRSTIGNAIQLAEVAGLLASRSMGMKGTRIRILDRAALEEAVSRPSRKYLRPSGRPSSTTRPTARTG